MLRLQFSKLYFLKLFLLINKYSQLNLVNNVVKITKIHGNADPRFTTYN